ncbi:MAG: DUF5658 family protein [Chloroflexota bacterium]
MVSRLTEWPHYQRQTGATASRASFFTQGLAEKLTFVCLHQIDLLLTVLGVSIGLSEINPLMRALLTTPPELLAVKVATPLLMAGFIPGKWLRPAIAVLALVIGWNLKELLVFLL